MAFAPFITIVAVSVALGIFGSRSKSRRTVTETLFVTLVLFANLVQCLPYFISDPHAWTETFGSGLILGCIPLLLVTALPALVGCGITRCVVRSTDLPLWAERAGWDGLYAPIVAA